MKRTHVVAVSEIYQKSVPDGLNKPVPTFAECNVILFLAFFCSLEFCGILNDTFKCCFCSMFAPVLVCIDQLFLNIKDRSVTLN